MSARPGLCGGHRATGVPTAITNRPKISGSCCSLRNRLHGIVNTGEESLVRARKGQVVVIRYIRLWANPRHLWPEESGKACPLGRIQGEAIVHKNAYVSLLLWHFKYILFEVTGTKVNGTAENVPLVILGTGQTSD